MRFDTFLHLKTTMGDISLPFKGLSELDTFTAMYRTKSELVLALINCLQIDIDPECVKDVSVVLFYHDRENSKNMLPIMYNDDYYDTEMIKENLMMYLSKNKDEIRNFDVQYVRTNSMKEYQNRGIYPTDWELSRSIEAFFKNDSYKKIRDTYFKLKKLGGISKKNRKPTDVDDNKSFDLSKYNINDSYLMHLLSLATSSDKAMADVMEYIAGCDLETLSKFTKPNGVGIVDGVTDVSTKPFDEDMYVLELLSLGGIDNLRNIALAAINHRQGKIR